MPTTRFFTSLFLVVLIVPTVSSASDVELERFRIAAEKGDCAISFEGKQEPAVALSASTFDLPTVSQQEVIQLLDRFIGHGCSIHAADSNGVSPVNVAVLTSQPELLTYLLKKGGDPTARIVSSRQWANGKNSLELAELIFRTKPSPSRAAVIDILRRHESAVSTSNANGE
ncbi:hypothetical protein [Stutzerimonas stutzeri]|uniref:hypothetical protein n=1 Tax=Stutzerimonas stutzeri TaxID=316 RepID=UPI0012D48DC6|nr:hypothetical protein [Stutzerimonas stutzeri]MBA1225294.1 hypothetical protein [Stutzerimonas stutzeri]